MNHSLRSTELKGTVQKKALFYYLAISLGTSMAPESKEAPANEMNPTVPKLGPFPAALRKPLKEAHC